MSHNYALHGDIDILDLQYFDLLYIKNVYEQLFIKTSCSRFTKTVIVNVCNDANSYL